MAQAHSVFALAYLQDRPLPAAAQFALYAAVVIVSWAERRRTRVALKHLDAHMLKDIGLTPSEARKEFERPFWRA